MTDLVERVARTIFNRAVGEGRWENHWYADEKAGCYTAARAAILETLRGVMEPSEAMIREGETEMPVEMEYWQENRTLHCEVLPRHKCVPPEKVFRAMLTQKIKEVEGD